MKTKEQIIEWLKGQEWFEEFCSNASFLDEGKLSDYIQMSYPRCVISGAFIWVEKGYGYWNNCHHEYLKWLESNDEQSVPNDQNFVFEGGKREAPFYMVYVEGQSSPTRKHGTIESATKEADRLAKSLNKKSFVLAAVMEIRPEIVTSAISIENMKKEDYQF